MWTLIIFIFASSGFVHAELCDREKDVDKLFLSSKVVMDEYKNFVNDLSKYLPNDAKLPKAGKLVDSDGTLSYDMTYFPRSCAKVFTHHTENLSSGKNQKASVVQIYHCDGEMSKKSDVDRGSFFSNFLRDTKNASVVAWEATHDLFSEKKISGKSQIDLTKTNKCRYKYEQSYVNHKGKTKKVDFSFEMDAYGDEGVTAKPEKVLSDCFSNFKAKMTELYGDDSKKPHKEALQFLEPYKLNLDKRFNDKDHFLYVSSKDGTSYCKNPKELEALSFVNYDKSGVPESYKDYCNPMFKYFGFEDSALKNIKDLIGELSDEEALSAAKELASGVDNAKNITPLCQFDKLKDLQSQKT